MGSKNGVGPNGAAAPLSVSVFASASPETPDAYIEAAAELGARLADAGFHCVNGGGSRGCMGALNRAVQKHGGRVTGVIHEKWIGEEAAAGLDELIVVGGDDLCLRKQGLFDNGDVLVTLPGGVGTIDELFDGIAGVHTGLSTLPICIVNVNGYYDHMLAQLQRAVDERLIRMPYASLLHSVSTPAEAVEWCRRQKKRNGAPKVSSSAYGTAKLFGLELNYVRGLLHGATAGVLCAAAFASILRSSTK